MKLKKNSKFILFIVIGIMSGFVVLQLNEQQVSGDTFQIIISDSGELSTIPNVVCHIKQTTYAIDTAGKTLSSAESPFLIASPFYSLATQDSKAVAGFVVIPKIRCKSPYDLIITQSDLELRVYSKTNTGTEIQTVQKGFSLINGVIIPKTDTEKELGYASIYARDISNKLPMGNYGSLQTLQIVGTIHLKWNLDNVGNTIFGIFVKPTSIATYFNMKVVDDKTQTASGSDTDQDGILNAYDLCPTQKEIFNGYKDADGCPDTEQQQTTTTTQTTSTMPTISSPTEITIDYCQKVALYYKKTNYQNFVPFDKTKGDTLKSGYSIFYIQFSNQTPNSFGCIVKDGLIKSTTITATSGKTGKLNIFVSARFEGSNSFSQPVLATTKPLSGSIGQIPFQELLGSFSITGERKIDDILIEAYLTFDNNRDVQVTTLKDSVIKFTPYILINNKRFDLTPQDVSQKLLCTVNGQVIERTTIDSCFIKDASGKQTDGRIQGITTLAGVDPLRGRLLAEAHIRPSEILTNSASIFVDGKNTVLLHVDVTGDIAIDYNDGQIKSYKGTIKNAYVDWGLVGVRPTGTTEQNTEKANCDPNTQNTVTINGKTTCQDKELVEIDINDKNCQGDTCNAGYYESDGLTQEEQNIKSNPETPKVLNGQIICESADRVVYIIEGDVKCLSVGSSIVKKPVVGEPTVDICTSPSKSTGFACTQVYRDIFCDGKTKCPDYEQSTNIDPKKLDDCDDGLFNIDITKPCIKTGTETTDEKTIVTNVNGGNTDVCFGGNCALVNSFIENNLVIMAIGIIVIAVIIYIKR